jgi:hypothetical protein
VPAEGVPAPDGGRLMARRVYRDRWAKSWAEHGHPDNPASRGAVAGWLYAKARPDGTRACAGAPWLAAVSGVSERTVNRVVSALKGEGWVTVRERGHYRGPTKPATATIYDLTIPAAPTRHPDDTLTPVVNTPIPAANTPPRVAYPFPSKEGLGAAALSAGDGDAQNTNGRHAPSWRPGATQPPAEAQELLHALGLRRAPRHEQERTDKKSETVDD